MGTPEAAACQVFISFFFHPPLLRSSSSPSVHPLILLSSSTESPLRRLSALSRLQLQDRLVGAGGLRPPQSCDRAARRAAGRLSP